MKETEKPEAREPREVPLPVPEPPKVPETFESAAELKRTLKTLLAGDEFETVFSLFAKMLDPTARLNDDLILLQGRYNNHKRSALQGTVSAERLNIERNQIRAALLGYTDQLGEDDLQR
jgi:hypothetical protein